METISLKLTALAQFLSVAPDDLIEETENSFELGNQSYLVLTDNEADKACVAFAGENLWAFSPSFLSDATGIAAAVFRAIAANGNCDANNGALLSIVKATTTIEDLTQLAIRWDGRGTFLSQYDGAENEAGDFYIYRTN